MLQTIYRILDDGHKEHPLNRIFPIIKRLVATTKRVPTLIELYLAVSEEGIGISEPPATRSIATNADRRIMHLIVSSFKTFSKNDEEMYGVDFRDTSKRQPSSTVILGSNGIGKTSVYTALEMVAMRHSYIGDIFGYNAPSRQQEFVRNVNTPEEAPLASIVNTSGNETSYPGDSNELCPRAFFCSQFDIQEYQTAGINRNYILDQLGRSMLFSLLSQMNELVLITKKLNTALNIALKLRNASDQEKPELRSLISQLRADVKEKLGLSRLRLVQPRWATNEITNEISVVVQVIRKDIDLTFNKFSLISATLIPLLLDKYLKDDDAHIKVTSNEYTVSPEIVLNHQSKGIEPRLWLNTFRMKLFIIAIKTSLAFTSKIIDNLNFPIVMDDVFDSSDFNNKFEISRFFQSIVSGHDSNQTLRQMPLQIICFTQDRLIGDNVYEGILRSSSGVPVKYCRMFHHKEATQRDKTMVIDNIDYLNVIQPIACSR